MKNLILIKFGLILPFILLVDYVAMVLLGCVSCLLGFGHNYYCNAYCVIGKGILLLSVIIFGLIIYPQIKELITRNKYGASKEK